MLVMRKSDFMVSGGNGYLLEKGTHLEITPAQATFVAKNPGVNGPKLALHLVLVNGMPKEVADAAFMEILRKEQDKQDKGSEPYTPPVQPEPVAVKTEPEPAVETKEEKPQETLDAATDLLKSFDAMTDKADIVNYAVTTLGMKAKDFDARWGRERIIETVKAKLIPQA